MAAWYCSRSLASICCDLKPRRWMSRFGAKYFQGGSTSPNAMLRTRGKAQILGGSPAFRQRVEDNAFHLENDHRIPDAHEILYARGVPIREANAAVTRGTANGLRIVRAVNADT